MNNIKEVIIFMLCINVIAFCGIPIDCDSRVIGGCFKPSDPNEPDTDENIEIRNTLYDETVKFLKEMNFQGGGGIGVLQTACDIAIQLLCFASGVDNPINAGQQVRRLIGVPQPVWRKLLRKEPVVVKTLLAALWNITKMNQQVSFDNPILKNAFADIRRLWKKGRGSFSGGSDSVVTSLTGVTSSRSSRNISNFAFPNRRSGIGSAIRRPPVVVSRATQTGQTYPTISYEIELEPTPMQPSQQQVLQTQSKQPSTATQPTGGVPGGGQGGQPINICLFCTPDQAKASQQQQSQQPPGQSKQPQGQQQPQGGQQNGCTCATGGQAQSQATTGNIKSLLKIIDVQLGWPKRSPDTPKDAITLEEFRTGLQNLMSYTTCNAIAQEGAVTLPPQFRGRGGIAKLLWICKGSTRPGQCEEGSLNYQYSENECKKEKLGEALTDVEVCPYIVLKNIKMCLEKEALGEVDSMTLSVINKVIDKVIKGQDSLLQSLRQANRALKTFLNMCSHGINDTVNRLMAELNRRSCNLATKNAIMVKINALRILMRNNPSKCIGEQNNFYKALMDALEKYKMLYEFIPIYKLISPIEYNGCLDETGGMAYSAYIPDRESSILKDVFSRMFLTELRNAANPAYASGLATNCLNISRGSEDSDKIKEYFGDCDANTQMSLPICAAAGLKKWTQTGEVHLYMYPGAPDPNISGNYAPLKSFLEHCTYKDVKISYNPGSGYGSTFTMANAQKNLLLCMLSYVMYEGKQKNEQIMPADNKAKALYSFLLGHGCRKDFIGPLKTSEPEVSGEEIMCGDVGSEAVGIAFLREKSRKILTLPEILDSVFYYIIRNGQKRVFSGVTDVSGGPIWQYCLDPSYSNLHQSIIMVYKFWAMLYLLVKELQVQDQEKSNLEAYILNEILTPITVGSIPNEKRNVVDMDTSTPPLNVIAQLIIDKAKLGELFTKVINIAEKIKANLKNVQSVKMGKVAYECQQGQQCTIQYDDSNCSEYKLLSVKDGKVTLPQNKFPGGEGLEKCSLSAMVTTLQSIILYYMIGAPYFFYDKSGEQQVIMQTESRDLASLLIFGDEDSTSTVLFPFKEKYAHGLWKLPFYLSRINLAGKKSNIWPWSNFLDDVLSALIELHSIKEANKDLPPGILSSDSTTGQEKTFETCAASTCSSNKVRFSINTAALSDSLNVTNFPADITNKDCIAAILGSGNCGGNTNFLLPVGSSINFNEWITLDTRDRNAQPQWSKKICKFLLEDDLKDAKTPDGSGLDTQKANNYANKCATAIYRMYIFIGLFNRLLKKEELKLSIPDFTGGIEPVVQSLPSFFAFYSSGEKIVPLLTNTVNEFILGGGPDRLSTEEEFEGIYKAFVLAFTKIAFTNHNFAATEESIKSIKDSTVRNGVEILSTRILGENILNVENGKCWEGAQKVADEVIKILNNVKNILGEYFDWNVNATDLCSRVLKQRGQ